MADATLEDNGSPIKAALNSDSSDTPSSVKAINPLNDTPSKEATVPGSSLSSSSSASSATASTSSRSDRPSATRKTSTGASVTATATGDDDDEAAVVMDASSQSKVNKASTISKLDNVRKQVPTAPVTASTVKQSTAGSNAVESKERKALLEKKTSEKDWINVASIGAGAQVVFASSMERRLPPNNCIDGVGEQPFITTGLYPQDIIISLSKLSVVYRFRINTKHVRRMTLYRCENATPNQFEEVFETESGDSATEMQDETRPFAAGLLVRYMKLRIHSGWDDFACVYAIGADGVST